MKKLILFIVILSLTLLFINCGEPTENVHHYITLSQGEEFDFQLNPTTKWDTIFFDDFIGTGEPEHAEFYNIYKKDGNPPYYHFFYVADNEYVGEDYAEIKLERSDGISESYFYQYFYITIVASELP